MGEGQTSLYTGSKSESVACPGEQRGAVSDDPVGCAVEVEDRKGGVRGLGRDQGVDWGGRNDALVEEWDAKEGAGNGREE